METLNRGFDMAVWNGYREKVIKDRSNADREKIAVAHWVQGEETRVSLGGHEVTIGSDDGLNMMEMLLASFAACDAAVVALHASYMGIKINELKVEVSGHFNVASYVGVEGSPGSGYDRITMRIHLDAPGATAEQIDHLKHMCEVGSPVGDTLTRNVPIELDIVASA